MLHDIATVNGNNTCGIQLSREWILEWFLFYVYIICFTRKFERQLPTNNPVTMPSHVHSTARIHNIACIPGDGIGVDITEAAIQVLETLSKALGTFEFNFTTFDWSSKNFLERGWYMPPDGLEQLKKFDAIYFGAVGWPGESQIRR